MYPKVKVVAMALAFATLFASCKDKVATVDLNPDNEIIPVQSISHMQAVQVEGTRVTGRLTAPLMERYEGERPYDIFPNTFKVEGYTVDGELETEITALKAVHYTDQDDLWEAYGNVVIYNHIKQERMETDTLYWDRKQQLIYTHCFVKLSSPSFFAQGYGMEANERASNAKILNPFDSYGYVQQSEEK